MQRVLVLAILALAGCFGERDAQQVPLPRLPEGPIELRVSYIVNERFPQLSEGELRTLLDSARDTVKAHFGKEVRFTEMRTEPIAALFERLQPVYSRLQPLIYDFKNGRGDLPRLKKGFADDLRRTGDDLDAMIEYALPYVLHGMRERSYAGLTDALMTTQLARLEQLAKAQALDGAPLIDAHPYNEFLYWDAVGHARWPYEIIVTNQLIASVEYVLNSVHSALRGGITNGLTSTNQHSRLGTTAVVSVYPFYGEDPVTRALRGGESYSREDAARFAGVLLAHELGHQLFHLGHSYGRTECVMNPTPLLRFRPWVEGLAPERCPLASDRGMTPGTAKFRAAGTL